jgi:hypothetical protein
MLAAIELAKRLACRSFVGGGSIAARGERTNVARSDGDPPFPGVLVERHTSVAGRVVVLVRHVLLVLGSRCQAQIFPAVVRTIRVAMIDIFRRRIFASHPTPDDTMNLIARSVYANMDVAAAGRSCWRSRMSSVPSGPVALALEMNTRSFAPRQRTGSRRVVETLAQIFRKWDRFEFGHRTGSIGSGSSGGQSFQRLAVAHPTPVGG